MTTTWRGRQGKKADAGSGRILCGWHAGTTYCAAPPIAWVDDDGERVYLPMGLTDDGTPGQYRWSSKVRRHVRVQRMPWRWGGPAAWTLPCEKGHLSIVDAGVLWG